MYVCTMYISRPLNDNLANIFQKNIRNVENATQTHKQSVLGKNGSCITILKILGIIVIQLPNY